MPNSKLSSKFLSEFLGTFFMVFFGCGAMILSELDENFPAELIPFAWGGSVCMMIYTLGHISGAHFNPAVSISFFWLKRLSLYELLLYITAQLFGALSASLVHLFLWGRDHSFGVTSLSINYEQAACTELILSFCLMFIISSVAFDKKSIKSMGGLNIGLTVALCAYLGGPLTKASMNPARTLGPAIISGQFDNLSIYLFFTVVGAMLGALSYHKLRA